MRNPPRSNREPSVGPTSFRSKHGQLPHDLFESEHSSLVGDLVLMPVRLAVAIDRVQLLDTLNLSSQLGNLLTESSIYKRQSTWCVGCSGGRAHRVPLDWINGAKDNPRVDSRSAQLGKSLNLKYGPGAEGGPMRLN
jgi:hypothetical protein